MLTKDEIATFLNVVTLKHNLQIDKLMLAEICGQAMTAIDLSTQVRDLQESGRAMLDADPASFQPDISLDDLLAMPGPVVLAGVEITEEALKEYADSVLTVVPTNGTLVSTPGGNKPCEDTNLKSSLPSSPRAKTTQR